MSTTTDGSDASSSEATSPNASESFEDDDAIRAASPLDTEERPMGPSGGIRGDLQRIFAAKEFKHSGSFYASESQLSSNAPNPGICAGKSGLMGLPLVESTAKLLIASCTRTTFRKGQRTKVGKNIRDTWEMDASKVTFANPAWNTWVDTVVLPSICEILGVKIKTSKPRVELSKLLVYEKGSHFLPHQGTAKAPGMFATMVILLPSQFTGGAIDLSHSGQRATIDAATNSAFSTHIAAWYTDVSHAIQPVLSGYRLALFYNLIHTTELSLTPVLVDMSGPYEELRRTLTAWKVQGQPAKLFSVMDHMYSAHSLRGTSLKGKDAHIVSHIRGLADELGFHLGLVNLELHMEGYAEEEEEYRGFRGIRWNSPAVEIHTRTLSIKHAVDLDGNPLELHEKLSMDEETEFFPRTLGDDNDAPDKSEHEEDYGGAVNRWYRRTALLIWPEEHHFDVGIKDIGAYAEEQLNRSDSDKPTEKEQKIAERLIAWSSSGHEEPGVIQAVRSAAVRWGNVEIWLRICGAGGVVNNLDLLGAEAIAQDVELFGFATMSEFLTSAIEQNRTDEPRFQLLAALEPLAKRASNKALLKWIEKQEDRVLRSLRVANARGIRRCLIATHKRGYVCLRDIIIPQLVSLKPKSTFWLAFTNQFREFKDRLRLDNEQKEEAIQILASHEISARDPFPANTKSKHYPASWEVKLDVWSKNINDAIVIGDIALKPYLENMVASWDRMPTEEKQWVARSFIPGAMDRLLDTAGRCTPPRLPGDASLAPFWLLALTCYLGDYNLGDCRSKSPKLLTALRWCGDYEWSRESFAPIIRKLAEGSSRSLRLFVTHCYESPPPFRIDKTIRPSLMLLAGSCAGSLSAHAPLGGTDYDWSRKSAPEPDFRITFDLIRISLRHSLPGPVMQLSRKALDVLAVLDEPSRFSKWLQYMFEAAPNAEVPHMEIEDVYKRSFSGYGPAKRPTAFLDLLKIVPDAIPQATPWSQDDLNTYVVRGIRRRRHAIVDRGVDNQEGDSSDSPTQPKLFDIILMRLSDVSMTRKFLNSCLLPLISACITEFHSLGIDWPSQPLAGFASDAIHGLVTMVGSKPLRPLTDAELANFGCGCTNCLHVRQFAAGSQKTVSIRAILSDRNHVESELSRGQARTWGFQCETIRTGSPHILQITKPKLFGAQKSWTEKTKPAVRAMSSLGPPPVQAAVLGDRYTEICSILRVPIPPAANSTHQAHAGPSSAPPRPTEGKPPEGNQASRAPTGNPLATAPSKKRRYHDALSPHTSVPAPKRNKPVEVVQLSD